MSINYIVYHPERESTNLGDYKIYHDKFDGNEDPYIWNKEFLHSFCHITQMSPQVGSKIFWVSGDTYPDFNKLDCDCVFVVKEKIYWSEANRISIDDKVVDNEQIFEHHYNWVNPPHYEHQFLKRKRYTLKADSDKSFQPQDKNQALIDIIPFLNGQGITKEHLRNSISRTRDSKRARNSRPFKLPDELAVKLYEFLLLTEIKIKGQMIENRHPPG